MDHLDLCSGIGGFALAARWMGWKTVGFAEIDEFASKVLEKHWPGVPNYGDIRSVPDGTRADILTAGFPCQPYSCAGKQLGAEDDRAIWPLVFEVVRRVQPSWCVFENVPGIIGMALDGVLSDLEEEGYETGTVVLPACAVNAPHRRDRVWIIAHDASGANRQDHAAPCAGSQPQPGIRSGSTTVADASRIGERKPANEADALANGGQARVESGERREPFSDAHREPMGRATEPRGQRGGGQPEPGLGRTVDGIPRRMDGAWDGDWERGVNRVAIGVNDRAKRLKALGNAIVPQVAYRIFRSIAEADRGHSQRGS